jgi:hypothetical protein
MMKIGPAVAAAAVCAIASPVCAQDAVQWRVEDGGNGHWYRLEGPYFVSWLSARTYAESMGGHLVTLTSETEQAFAADVAFNSTPNQVDDCWLGAMQDLAASDFSEPAGGWRWVTGEPWGFTAWRTITGAPNGPGEFLVSTTVPSDQLRWVDGRAPHEPGNCQAFVEWSADCNSDGIVDYGQIRDGTFTDLNANGVPDECETPVGEYLISDSAVSFSSVQGSDGWRYEFDRGESTEVQPMPHFVTPAYSGSAWCTRPTFGWPAGSYCAIGATACGTSTPNHCSSAYAGLERSRRRWIGESPVRGSLALMGQFFSHDGYTAQLNVLLDGVLAHSISSSISDTVSNPTVINVVLPLEGVTSIELVADPLDGSCHSDTVLCVARIFGADCNGDGIVDYGQIRDGTFPDVNANGVPDCCEPGESCVPCPGDVTDGGTVDAADLSILLAAWGTNGQGEFDTDLNGDGLVDGGDLALVLGGWGACP